MTIEQVDFLPLQPIRVRSNEWIGQSRQAAHMRFGVSADVPLRSGVEGIPTCIERRPGSIPSGYPDSLNLNLSNRSVRTRTQGGVAGAQPKMAPPYADRKRPVGTVL